MKLTTDILLKIGFEYDVEDNLYYDTKNKFRVGVRMKNWFDLYYGGYDNYLGHFSKFEDFIHAQLNFLSENEKRKNNITKL